jgi:hypothetical protein
MQLWGKIWGVYKQQKNQETNFQNLLWRNGHNWDRHTEYLALDYWVKMQSQNPAIGNLFHLHQWQFLRRAGRNITGFVK